MRGPGSIIPNMQFLFLILSFRSRRAWLPEANETVRHEDSIGINVLAVRLQKLFFMKPQNSKVEQTQIEILRVLAFL